MHTLDRQDSSHLMARASPRCFFTILSVIALICVSCSGATGQTSSSQRGTAQSSRTTKGAGLPLTDSGPPQGDATPTVLPTAFSPVATESGLTLYENGVLSPLFVDNSFRYSSATPCDRTTFVSPPCSYAITYQAYGAIELRSQHGNMDPGQYTGLQYDIETGGQPIKDFGVILSTSNDQWISEYVIASANITATFSSQGKLWYQVTFPMSQLDSSKQAFGVIDLENSLNNNLQAIHIDDIRLLEA